MFEKECMVCGLREPEQKECIKTSSPYCPCEHLIEDDTPELVTIGEITAAPPAVQSSARDKVNRQI